MTGAQLFLATLQLAVVTPLFTTLPTRFPLRPPARDRPPWARWARASPCCIQYGLVAEVGPTTAQMVTYFIPVIATAAGVALLDEPLSWSTPVGAAIVLAGAALTQVREPVLTGARRFPVRRPPRAAAGLRRIRARRRGPAPRRRPRPRAARSRPAPGWTR